MTKGAALLLAAAIAMPAPAADWLIDPTHTFVTAELLHGGLSTLRVRFDRKTAELALDRAARSGRVRFVLDVGSLSTGVPAFDAALKSAALLDAATHREAVFSAERLQFTGDAVAAVDGHLAWRGRTRPLRLQAVRFNCYISPLFQREVCGGDFEAALQRADWAIADWGGALADTIVLRVQIEALRQP